MVVKASSACLVVLSVAACGETVTHQRQFAFTQGRIELTITSSGGAFGDERYELKSAERTIFSGSNFSEFNVSELRGKLNIQLCKGSIDHAEPWLIGSGESLKLVRLNIDWNCTDQRQET